jgi:hypothetical protein
LFAQEDHSLKNEMIIFNEFILRQNPDPDTKNKPYNVEELEACDAFDEEDSIYLMRFDGDTHQISHQVGAQCVLVYLCLLSLLLTRKIPYISCALMATLIKFCIR